MIPCPACKRHLRAHEFSCPFCAADLTGTAATSPIRHNLGAFALTAAFGLGLVACAGDPAASDDGQTTTSQGDDSTGESTTTATTDPTTSTTASETGTDTSDGNDDDWSSSGSFYAVPEDFSGVSECDPWLQDCPDGEKCVPYASTGGTWDANKCVPILGDGAPGDPCTSTGLIEATDDCDADSVCWHAGPDQPGACTSFCAPDPPSCEADQACMIANRGSINLCLDACDPLGQDCDSGFGCFFVSAVFVCMVATEAPLGEPCGYVNDCPAASVCVAAEQLPGCAGESCCAAYCSLSEPACAQPDTTCVALFEPSEPPTPFDDVGLCRAMP